LASGLPEAVLRYLVKGGLNRLIELSVTGLISLGKIAYRKRKNAMSAEGIESEFRISMNPGSFDRLIAILTLWFVRFPVFPGAGPVMENVDLNHSARNISNSSGIPCTGEQPTQHYFQASISKIIALWRMGRKTLLKTLLHHAASVNACRKSLASITGLSDGHVW
jgi:hypothetical protein